MRTRKQERHRRRYGKRKVPVLAEEMALFPRFKVPALKRPAQPHIRTHQAYPNTDRRRRLGHFAVEDNRPVPKIA